MVLGESTYLQGFSFYLFSSLHSMIDPLMVVLADFSETCMVQLKAFEVPTSP